MSLQDPAFLLQALLRANGNLTPAMGAYLRGRAAAAGTPDEFLAFQRGLASLADVVSGLHVRLRGRPVGDALVVATEIEARSPDVDVDLRGSVSAATDPTLTILGVTIDTTGLPDSAFREEDVVIGRTAFFAALGNGRPVEAKGRRNGNTVTWEEFELED